MGTPRTPEEQILRELRLIRAGVNPGSFLVKPFLWFMSGTLILTMLAVIAGLLSRTFTPAVAATVTHATATYHGQVRHHQRKRKLNRDTSTPALSALDSATAPTL
jgi:hypothetical protein